MAKNPRTAAVKPKANRIAAAAAKALIEGREALKAAATPPPAPSPPAAAKTPKVNAVRVLTAENARLSSAVETAVKDANLAAAAAAKAAARAETLVADNKVLSDELTTTKASLVKAEAEIAQLKASGDPHREGPLVLTADSVSSLLGDFVASFEGKLGKLQLGGSEIKLRAGFAQAAGKAAFVVPSATAPKDAVEGLHEIRLQLDPRSTA